MKARIRATTRRGIPLNGWSKTLELISVVTIASPLIGALGSLALLPSTLSLVSPVTAFLFGFTICIIFMVCIMLPALAVATLVFARGPGGLKRSISELAGALWNEGLCVSLIIVCVTYVASGALA